MESYEVSYSLFWKDNQKNHFSNCKTVIEGKTFDDAVEKFKERKLNEGWIVGYLVEGDMFEVEFVPIESN